MVHALRSKVHAKRQKHSSRCLAKLFMNLTERGGGVTEREYSLSPVCHFDRHIFSFWGCNQYSETDN